MKRFFVLTSMLFSVASFSQSAGKEQEVKVAAGLQKIKSENQPGATDTRISFYCGVRKTSPENDPLIVIDCTIADMNAMKAIDPNDIQSVTILKDAAAIKQYGEKAKHGVIVIAMKPKRTPAAI